MQILRLSSSLYPYGAAEGVLYLLDFIDNSGKWRQASYFYDYLSYPDKPAIKLEQELWKRTKDKYGDKDV